MTLPGKLRGDRLSMNMNELVRLGGLPRLKIPDTILIQPPRISRLLRILISSIYYTKGTTQ